MNIDIGCYYPEHLYDERVHDALVNPAGGGVLGSQIANKVVDCSAFGIGGHALLTANGDLEIESLYIRVTQAFTSGGAATIDIAIAGGTVSDPTHNSLANWTLNGRFGRSANTTVSPLAAGVALNPVQSFGPSGGAFIGGGAPLLANGQSVSMTIGTAALTGGAIQIYAVYTPLSPGATLS